MPTSETPAEASIDASIHKSINNTNTTTNEISTLNDAKFPRSLKQLTLDCFTVEQALEYFENGWRLYEMVMSSLKEDQHFYRIPNPLRRPLIFYLGHTACFYINKLIAAGLLTEEQRVNPHFEQIFAVGVDEMSWDDMIDQHFDWPPVRDVWEYRRQVHDVVVSLMQKAQWSYPVTWDKPQLWVFFMGMEHERIHLETSSVLIREMAVEYTRKPNGWRVAPSKGMPPVNAMRMIRPPNVVTVGKPRSFPTYGWDCEYGSEDFQLKPFEVSQFKVTNAEWLGFINDKGYEIRKYWDDEGWNWVQYTKARHPHFWVPLDASKYRLRTNYEIIDMAWDWPVEVNYLEAKAFCRWRGDGFRLITEPEWHVLTGITDKSNDESVCSRDPGLGSKPTDDQSNVNFDFLYGSPTPVDFYPPNELGIYDTFGNVWEWSESHYDGKPGFKTHELYLDFSTPCFDQRHNMILGGSFASTGNETSIYARYAFRRHFFQHAGFRLVRTIENVYESRTSLNQYIHFHYGTPETVMPHSFGPNAALEFPARCSQLCIEWYSSIHGGGDNVRIPSALDIGCATGRSSFELARRCERVLGIDYSHSFAKFCTSLRDSGKVDYEFTLEGEITQAAVAVVSSEIDRSRCEFSQGDAHDLLTLNEKFDVVLAANLIDRLHTPTRFLDQLPLLVNDGGVVVITSPYTWLSEFTPKESWLGGYYNSDGQPVHTFDTLKRLLGVSFDLIHDQPLPFLIHEHQRKFQWSVAHATVWRKKQQQQQ